MIKDPRYEGDLEQFEREVQHRIREFDVIAAAVALVQYGRMCKWPMESHTWKNLTNAVDALGKKNDQPG